MQKETLKYFDAFAGYGGFSLGIQQAYDSLSNTKGKKLRRVSDGLPDTQPKINAVECVGFSEIDKYAIQVYKKHFNHKNYGDITKIKPEELPDFDLFCGGFPCQAFSVAGKRGGFQDTRGTLFFEIARIIREKRPRLLLLENVKGLLSHDQGRTFLKIITTLDELWYDCQWQVLNAKNFGVPQNRERVFIVGHTRETPRPQIFPIRKSNKKTLKQIIGGSQGNRVYDPRGISTTQASQAGGQGAKTGLYAIPVITLDRKEKRQNGRRFKTNGEPMFTINTQDRHGIFINKTVRAGGRRSLTAKHNWDTHKIDGEIRRLTPLECERLMGLPDNWTAEGIEGKMSDNQRYRLCGNGVVVPIVKEITKKICQQLLKNS